MASVFWHVGDSQLGVPIEGWSPGPGKQGRMFLNIVKSALRALWRNAMRSFLTILGMVIGVAAVIAMVSIGRGASAAVQERIGTMGNNLLIVLSGSTTQA